MKTNDDNRVWQPFGIPIWAWLVLVGIVAVWWWGIELSQWLSGAGFKNGSGDLNEVGDSFGTINALFSGVALWGVIVTLILQSRELKQNTQELRKTAEAMDEQVEIASMTAQIGIIPTLIKNNELHVMDCRYVQHLSLPLSTRKDALDSLEAISAFSEELTVALHENTFSSPDKLNNLCLKLAKEEMHRNSNKGVFVDANGDDRFLNHQEDVNAVSHIWSLKLQGRGAELVVWAVEQVREAVAHHDSVDFYFKRLRDLSSKK